MTAQFKRARGGGIAVRFEPVEAQVLRSYVLQIRALVEPAAAEGADPLEELTGMSSGPPPARPSDPVLARLLPDGYGTPENPAPEGDEEQRNAEFRRLTERDLRTAKVADADALLAQIPESGGRVVLDEQAAERWLRALNDIRLALGSRLEVTEDTRADLLRLKDDEPRVAAYEVYGWLGFLQESLVDALVG